MAKMIQTTSFVFAIADNLEKLYEVDTIYIQNQNLKMLMRRLFAEITYNSDKCMNNAISQQTSLVALVISPTLQYQLYKELSEKAGSCNPIFKYRYLHLSFFPPTINSYKI